ncbi:unnamed protein product [Linum trigynum]|uniref:Uncharacterized protein n=1 Tax=Linum trigynum TaxID=586398 RepID=A0AAV2GR00_9ROSI
MSKCLGLTRVRSPRRRAGGACTRGAATREAGVEWAPSWTEEPEGTGLGCEDGPGPDAVVGGSKELGEPGVGRAGGTGPGWAEELGESVSGGAANSVSSSKAGRVKTCGETQLNS